jgi:hypothetical protein
MRISLIWAVVVLGFSGCVSYSPVRGESDASLGGGSAIVVFRLKTDPGLIEAGKPKETGMLKTGMSPLGYVLGDKKHKKELTAHYRLFDAGNQNSMQVYEIADDLHAIKVSGGLDKPFMLQFTDMEFVNTRSWHGKVGPIVAFELPEGGKVYYAGRFTMDEKGRLALSEDLAADGEELARKHPYLKDRPMVAVKRKTFQNGTTKHAIRAAFARPR